ncbi:alcohol dehydrogenase GroES domain protein [Amanita rubescens]|nr:alcohol dehydrogenase GroES domain protein [Amanita rubescens]
MKAARYYGPKDIRIEEIEKPIPKSKQVLIKVAWNGICGTDLHAYLATSPKFPTSTEPDPITGESLPITLGHEFSGTVAEHGPDVDDGEWPVGQQVTVEPIFGCGSCHSCGSGSRNTCRLFNTIGIGGWGGGLAEYIAVDLKYVHKLHDNIPLDIGACIEPISVAWHAINRSKFVKGQSALVLGAGPIGFLVLRVLRSIDPDAKIIVAEPAALRRDLAARHGATVVIDPTTSDITGAVLEATSDVGVDVAFDAAGLQSTVDAAINSVRANGTIMNIALWDAGVKAGIDMNSIVLKQITLLGTICYENDHPDVIAAVASGKISGLQDFISRRISLDDVVEKGFEALLKEKDTLVKVLVHP